MSILPKESIARASELVANRTGLHFPRERWAELERRLLEAAKEFGFEDLPAFLDFLESDGSTKKQVEMLARHLTVGETYFFREKAAFRVFENRILPELIASRRGRDQRLRIWSAGCCTGEEPYSIAATLISKMPDLAEWDVTLLATDINPAFLHRAMEGVYSDWSFRASPPGFKAKNFVRLQNGKYQISLALRQMVTFNYLNLAEHNYPSLLNNTNAMDLIFCRNVLIYLGGPLSRQVVERLSRCLAPEGWLALGAVETSYGREVGLTHAGIPGAPLYRRPVEATVASISTTPEAPAIPKATKTMQPPAPREVEKPVEVAPSTLDAVALLVKEGRAEEALKLISELPVVQRQTPEALSLLSRASADLGRLDESLAWCSRAIELDKLNPALQYLRAVILQEQGDLPGTIEALRRTLYLDSNFTMAHFMLGNISWHAGKPDEAERCFRNAQKVLRLGPEEIVPESGDMTAGRLREVIEAFSADRSRGVKGVS